ncbi:MmcB family DNA repair protein [Albimonas sp. CAU 1670]|uniref:MmcB family DNA repair protein n=1 Tax=Albimonas sp. CAU 1670 TaxID=3032599 RepID=UPI0023DA67EB|nr:MmcB family DNA repair protein [Albimonas sp. CAU 1670]MDF2231529.1 MmcB family DNA repair protein [Albimonas sp. CAU 1670]
MTQPPADLSAPLAADPQPGVLLARGVCRLLIDLGFAPIAEFVPARGLRADVFAAGPKGEMWIVECKSGLPDFRSDRKWPGYLDWCDRFFFAVDEAFPDEVLPPDQGLIRADAFGAEILRHPAEPRTLAPARRKALTLRAARVASVRLRMALDPGLPALSEI